MATIDVFGTLHVDRLSKVTDELDAFAADTDVFFVEGPRGNYSKLKFFLRNPTMFLTAILLEFFWGIIGFFLTRRWRPVDGAATDIVAKRHDIPIEPVDLNLPRRVSEMHILISVFSWLWFAVALGFFVSSVIHGSATLLIRGVLIGFMPILPFIYITLDERDRAMAENIAEIISEDGSIEHGCIIAGKKHMEGVMTQIIRSKVPLGRIHKSKFFRRNRQSDLYSKEE